MTTKTAFLSSTIRDLAEYRNAAFDSLTRSGYYPIRSENFPAADWDSNEFCRRKVIESDIFVGILGHCYGSCPPGTEQSYTEREYDMATSLGIPRLMFLASNEVLIPRSALESEENQHKQEAFRNRVNNERLRDRFDSAADLSARVGHAVHNWEREQWGQQSNPRQQEQLEQSPALTDQQHREGNGLLLPTGVILLVRYNGRYGAVQAVDQRYQSLREEYIRYAWWYQPDGTGIFTSPTTEAGFGEVRFGYQEREEQPNIWNVTQGPEGQWLHIGPIRLMWSAGGNGQGWVYFGESSNASPEYELLITNEIDITRIDATTHTNKFLRPQPIPA